MTKKILTIASIMAIVTSCSNDDLAVTQPDEFYSPISFGVESTNGEAKIITRADDAHSHIAYNKDRDPLTMGVYGFSNVTGKEPIFNNVEATYNEATTKWGYANTKYWGEYAEGTDFDFFAYMPYKEEEATLTGSGSVRTLSFPVTTDPISFNSKSGLICHAPVNERELGKPIKFQMDQILTGLQFEFQLGTRMDMIREFKITKVELYGSFPTSGTVSRTYTKTGSTWSAGDVTWSNLVNTAKVENDALTIKNAPSELIINQSATKTWGDPFYVIPDASFAPTIKVTYDVIVEGTITEENPDGVVSRKGVKSIIVFNSDNFSNYTSAGVTGKINPVKINIVPSYLYVLADSDQLQGYLVLE